jgi:putative flippase GtrA
MSVHGHLAAGVPAGAAHRELRRIARFCAVGVLNTVVTLAAFSILVASECPAPAASALGFCAGAANSFVLNRRWTFSDVAVARGAWVRFAAIQGAGAGLSAAAMSTLQSVGWPHAAAECAILPGVTILLYGCSRLLVFRPRSI